MLYGQTSLTLSAMIYGQHSLTLSDVLYRQTSLALSAMLYYMDKPSWLCQMCCMWQTSLDLSTMIYGKQGPYDLNHLNQWFKSWFKSWIKMLKYYFYIKKKKITLFVHSRPPKLSSITLTQLSSLFKQAHVKPRSNTKITQSYNWYCSNLTCYILSQSNY